MLGKVVFWIAVIWLVIYVVNNPASASAHVHSIWHVLFGSAGPQGG